MSIMVTETVQSFCGKRPLNVSGVLFVLSMMVMLNPIIADYDIPQNIIRGIAMLWVIAAFVSSLKRSSLRSKFDNKGDGYFNSIAKLFLFPKLLIWVYGMTIFFLGIASAQYGSTGVTQLLSILLPLSALYLFGAKAVDYIFWAVLISFIPQIYLTCLIDGLDSLAQWLASLINDAVSNPFENHEITFTAAFLFIYYACIDRYGAEKDALKVVACAIMLLLGFKRILVLSICAALLLAWICSRVGNSTATKLFKASSLLLLASCWLFLVLLYNGQFFDIVNSLGINVMGRNYYYSQIVSITELSPSFLGLGLNAVSNMLTTTYSYMHVGGVHSDILKYYAEIGFVGFALWSWFYLIKLPKMIERRFGVGSSHAMYIINTLTFVTYFTDNIDIYFGSQLLYVAIPIVFAMQHRFRESQASIAEVHNADFDAIPEPAARYLHSRRSLRSRTLPLERG